MFDRRFADLFHIDPETGQRYLDFELFHTTVPVLPASAEVVEVSASAGAGPG